MPYRNVAPSIKKLDNDSFFLDGNEKAQIVNLIAFGLEYRGKESRTFILSKNGVSIKLDFSGFGKASVSIDDMEVEVPRNKVGRFVASYLEAEEEGEMHLEDDPLDVFVHKAFDLMFGD